MAFIWHKLCWMYYLGKKNNRRKKEHTMKSLSEIKTDRDLVNSIDWDMTPEEAVRLYLEWGNNWAGGNYVIRSKKDVSYYFVVNTWKDKPIVYLIKRNSEEAEELAKIEMPPQITLQFFKEYGNHKGVFPIKGKVEAWLKQELGNA